MRATMRSRSWLKRATFGLLSSLLASVLIWSIQPGPHVTMNLQPLYGREHAADHSYRWTPPETTLTIHADRAVQHVVVRQRLIAGPTPRDTRMLVLRTDAITTSFLVQGGAVARVYRYLLPTRGHYLYGAYHIAPLQQSGARRPLGMAILDSRVLSVEPLPWPAGWMVALFLAALLVPLVAGWPGLVLMIGAMTIAFRVPELFTQPRFWAEEGVLYFQYAYRTSWLTALLTPHNGYFSLFNNVVSVLAAHLVPIERAPLVTTLAAFGVQLVPFVLILWARPYTSGLWQTDAQKLLAVAILLLAPVSAELWLTTICSQFFFSLIAFLVLVEQSDDASTARRWWYRLLLAVAGLTGPVACMLTPLFVFKAWIHKQREYRVQAGIMTLCLLAQLAIFLQFTRDYMTQRASSVNMTIVIATLWTKTIFVPLLGFAATDAIAEGFKRWCSAYIPLAIVSGYIAALITLPLVWLVARRLAFEQRVLILGSYICIAVPSILTSLYSDKADLISGINGFRYFYVPTLIALFLIATNIPVDRLKHGFVSTRPVLCTVFVALMLINGVARYRSVVLGAASGPQWELEARRWHVEPEYQPAITPPGWKLSLSRQPN